MCFTLNVFEDNNEVYYIDDVPWEFSQEELEPYKLKYDMIDYYEIVHDPELDEFLNAMLADFKE